MIVKYGLTWLSVAALFLAIDAVWLSSVANSFYRKHIGFLLREEFLMGPAALFYLFYTACLVAMVINPSVKAASPMQAVIYGALLGLCAYGTYDMTNLATVKGWPVIVSVADMAWGMFLTALVCYAGYQLMSRLPG
jgi:uncharacterized membrane protein